MKYVVRTGRGKGHALVKHIALTDGTPVSQLVSGQQGTIVLVDRVGRSGTVIYLSIYCYL
jgi:hypothetical protein